MDNWRKIVVDETTSIFDAIKVIDAGAIGAVLVVDHNYRLVGTITDGDVRRALLQQVDFNKAVTEIMNKKPKAVRTGVSPEKILKTMQKNSLHHIPVVNKQSVVMGLTIMDELIATKQHDNWVVIMAGGLGKRLRPLTEDCPKPLLKIESKPVLQIILEQLIEYGFHRFVFSLNYRGQMIRDYFKDGKQLGVTIKYIEEEQALGTAGPLGLFDQSLDQPLIVMNGDIITRLNFNHLLEFHSNQDTKATVCVREYQQTIPYGVVEINKDQLLALEEKPINNYFVNAGIYVLEPEILKYIPENQAYDMTDLIKNLIQTKHKTAVFPIREYWTDIGRIEDYKQAHRDYTTYFG